jgi:hypothetical protein
LAELCKRFGSAVVTARAKQTFSEQLHDLFLIVLIGDSQSIEMSRHLIRSVGWLKPADQLITLVARRSLLSASYACADQWNQRFKDPLIEQIDIGR